MKNIIAIEDKGYEDEVRPIDGETMAKLEENMETPIARNIIRYDFQGWPEYDVSVKELLQFINNNNVPMDAKIKIYQDDGMGYGANNGFCTSIETCDEDGKQFLRLWF